MKQVLGVWLLSLFGGLALYAQIAKVEPPNWWVGMANGEVQLLVHGQDISNFEPSISGFEGGPYLKGFHKGDSPNYLFLDVEIPSTAVAQRVPISFTNTISGESFEHVYELKGRDKKPEDFKGFNSSDVIYLITPDRFSNGNPLNDQFVGLLEQDLDRGHNYKRHGGDIAGIAQHLDYISEMGFTAIWPSPLLTNDMPEQSYHGYAITDFYGVDPRFGTEQEYCSLSHLASEKGIKLIMDQVANHCGLEHWWMKDLPFKNWINFQSDFLESNTVENTNHRRTVNQDPYASEKDKALMEQGWFVSAMPDLNQKNPFLATYLIQNSIWWIETLQLGGIRQDTYPYPNKEFMSKWARAIMNEYPNFNIVGEEWSYNPLLVGYWQDGAHNSDGYESNLRSTMDFPLQKALVDALVEPEKWDTGLIKLYEGLANDFAYTDPMSILLFGDNHDMDRLFTQLNEDVSLTKMALAFILAAPRIPQVYYGTEILMQNSDKPGDHGLIRTDFPGGWEGDTINVFTGLGLSDEQQDMKSFLKKMLNFRKRSLALQSGKTTHFAPKDGTYVMFRHNTEEMVMLVLNKSLKVKNLQLERFAEMGLEGKHFVNVFTDKEFPMDSTVTIAPRQVLVLSHRKELK